MFNFKIPSQRISLRCEDDNTNKLRIVTNFSAESSDNKLRIVTQSPESGKQELSRYSRAYLSPEFGYKDQTSQTAKSNCWGSLASESESDRDLSISKLQAEYRVAQLKLKYIRLRKELLTIPGYS